MILPDPETGAASPSNAGFGASQHAAKFTKPRPEWRLGHLLAWLLLILSGTAHATVPRGEMEGLYRRCQEACVEVLVGGRHAGSGWFGSRDGLVVTASHLFGDGGNSKVELLGNDDSRTTATLVAIDRGHDLAVLRTATRREAGRFLSLARKPPAVGEEIFQFGAPLFRSGVLQTGRIAAIRTTFEYYADLRDYVEVVHIAGMMQGGTSGGPWLNARGEVIGLQSGVMSLDGKPVGIAYLVPGEFIRNLLETLGNAATPSLGLGVDELWQQSGDFLQKLPGGTRGLVVAVLHADGPAAKAGIKAQDVIVSIDGQKVVRVRELLRQIRSRKPGDEVTLDVLTPGETNSVSRRVTLTRAEAGLAPTPGTP